MTIKSWIKSAKRGQFVLMHNGYMFIAIYPFRRWNWDIEQRDIYGHRTMYFGPAQVGHWATLTV